MSNYRQIVLEDSPVSYWRLGETSGTTAVDQMGLNNGTYSGTGYTLGVAGALFDDPDKAVTFNATDGQLSVPHSASLIITAALTVEAWVRMNAAPPEDGEVVLTKRWTDNVYGWWLRVDGHGTAAYRAIFAVYGEAASAETPHGRDVPVGAWVHLVGVYTGSLVRLYVDAVEQGVSTVFSNPLAVTDLAMNMGADSAMATFSNVSLDEVAIYNTALSAERIMAHYQAGVGAGLNQPPPAADDFPSARGRG